MTDMLGPCLSGVLVGWADHVFKALMRDGTFFICPQPQASANQRQEVIATPRRNVEPT